MIHCCRLFCCLAWLGLFFLAQGVVSQHISDVFAAYLSTGSNEHKMPGLSVYVYDLPANYQNLSSLQPHISDDYNNFLYGSEKRAPEALTEAGYVTQNASQANFFLVPIWLYAVRYAESLQIPGSLVRPERQALSSAISFISTHFPFWNASQGRDHIWVLTNDQGFCGFARSEETFDEIKDSVILSHWGLQSTEVHCTLQERLTSFNHCPTRAAKAGKAEHLPCFNPHKDVVIPSTAWDNMNYLPLGAGQNHRRQLQLQHSFQQQRQAQFSQAPQHRRLIASEDGITSITIEAISEQKDNTLFFVGSTRELAPEYSHGVRQTIVALFNTTPGFYLNRKPLSHDEMVREMGRSHFCLTPTGAGWGVRLKLATMVDCIPLVIQDNVQVPFEDVLPYKDFALRLPQHAIHDLPRILEELLAKQPQRVREMRERLQCAQHYFSWRPDAGRAVHALACSLLMKLSGLEVVPHLDWQKCLLQCDAPRR